MRPSVHHQAPLTRRDSSDDAVPVLAGNGLASAPERCEWARDLLPPVSIETWLLQCSSLEAIALDHHTREIARTRGATELLSRWFSAVPRTGALPTDLVASLEGHRPAGQMRQFLVGADDAVLLGWVFHRPPALQGITWLVVLEQRPRRPAVPARWREKLTPRELQIAELVTQGMSNAEIATELGITLQSVKQRVQRIFDALGVESRTRLCVRAFQEACRLSPSFVQQA